MKLFIATLSLLIFFWNINVQSPDNENNRINQHSNTALENYWNNDFNGLWLNEDDKTRSITKCKISYKNNSYVVQMWGDCHPEDCDWGENVANDIEKGTDKFELLWDQEFAESLVTYQIIDGKLTVTNKRRFKDNSGRANYELVEYFKKQ